jgi:hypothetical protein
MDCGERHLHECPDYSGTGSCRSKLCSLPHIDRAGQMRRAATTDKSGITKIMNVDNFGHAEGRMGDDDLDSVDTDADDDQEGPEEFWGSSGRPQDGPPDQLQDFVALT